MSCEVIARQFKAGSQLVIALDRTQWKEYNVLMVSDLVQKRAFPIFWTLLDKHGASNLVEQQQVLRPVIRLLKRYKLVILGSARISQYRAGTIVTPQAFEFCYPSKKQHYFPRKKTALSIAKQPSGSTRNSSILSESRIPQRKGFSRLNLVAYWKRQYRGKQEDEPWYLLTNLPDLKSAIGVYGQRYGLEAMFKDCKRGGYNLEGCQASSDKLISLIILIALAMTSAWLKGKITQLQG